MVVASLESAATAREAAHGFRPDSPPAGHTCPLRGATGRQDSVELQLSSGRTIDVPSLFIAGKSDWGVYQRPGNFERMQTGACTNMHGCHLLDGAGHWVQQEQPEQTSDLLITFLRGQPQPASTQ